MSRDELRVNRIIAEQLESTSTTCNTRKRAILPLHYAAVSVQQAGSWKHERQVVCKAEALDKGLNIRFVVTTRDDPPDDLYSWYTQRGDRPELCITLSGHEGPIPTRRRQR